MSQLLELEKSEVNLEAAEFDRFLSSQAESFYLRWMQIIQGYSEATVPGQVTLTLGRPLLFDDRTTVSLLFVGPVMGELIVSLPQALKSRLFETFSTSSDEQNDFMLEMLNQVAGSRLADLSKHYERLTLTPPRVSQGRVKFPSAKNAQVVWSTPFGDAYFAFYVDRMRLDLAESYKTIASELKVTNERHKAQQAQLVHSEKMASLGMMAAGVAHEINNPLAFVLSNTEMLESYFETADRFLELSQKICSAVDQPLTHQLMEGWKKEDLDYVHDDSKKLLKESKDGLERIREIVKGLKRFSRVDDLEIKRVKIESEIQNVLTLLHNETKYRAEVQLDFGQTPEIECHAGELGQVFVNLIINAVHALPENGGKIQITTRAQGDLGIEIRVRDTGRGIPKEAQEKIFSPFFTTKPVGEGTGLGLAISYGIVQKHGGTITFTSEVGQGTEFCIRLPKRPPEALGAA